MKRTIEFQVLEDSYSFVEEDRLIFEIDRRNLQFDVKRFYQGFYSKGSECLEIELKETGELDKNAKHVFSTIRQLIKEINERLNAETIEEVNKDAEDEDVSEELESL